MTAVELSNWISLYAAAFVLTSLCAGLTTVVWVVEVFQTSPWKQAQSLGAKALFLPKLWWLWQKRYLSGTPVILAILAVFGLSLSWR